MKDPYFGLYNCVNQIVLKSFLSLKEIPVSLIRERNFHLPAPCMHHFRAKVSKGLLGSDGSRAM